jgi:diguanylate cyclase (GGDEF)-like protein/PAS domain S-box-containing protein
LSLLETKNPLRTAATTGGEEPRPGGAPARPTASDDEIRDMSRLTVAITAVVVVFTAMSVLVVLDSGDMPSAVLSVIEAGIVVMLLAARHMLWHDRVQRGVVLIVVATLGACVAMAIIPPPIPALAAGPIMPVAFALSFLHGRRLKVTLIVAWIVSVVTATIVEFTPASPDMSPEIAAMFRIGSFGAIIGLVAFVLFRHRRRLEQAMTDARSASEALMASESRYRTVVESVQEVIYRVDVRGRWSLLNHAWEAMTGYPVSESIGRRVIDFVHVDDREHHAALAERLVNGHIDEYRDEVRIISSTGAVLWLDARGKRIEDDDGRFVGTSGTLSDISGRRGLEERLMQQAFHDDLTGLANRALFKDRVEHALTRRLHGPRLVGLLFLDLDRFKTVNDSLGHTVGDELLVSIAHRLLGTVRAADTIARLGGDEFAILVEDTTLSEVVGLAERISASFDAAFPIGEREITIRSSIGVVLGSADHPTADDLLRDADVAMYRAKVTGRGSYALFQPSMQAEVAARLELESDLRAAIAAEQLTLVYQPIVDLGTNRIVAVEALARWSHAVRGVVPPSVFIPSAEESGLIIPFGRWVLRRACQDLAALRRETQVFRDLRLGVNLSARQLEDRTIVSDILGALQDAGLSPGVLDLEITESLVLDSGEEGLGYLRSLRAAGCGVSFDDFGTGFSSMGNLRSLPIDGLKIDMSFVGAMLNGGVDAAVVEAVVSLGAALGVAVVAEGVEDQATADRLRQLGCPYGQGYLFGRPQPAAALVAGAAVAVG